MCIKNKDKPLACQAIRTPGAKYVEKFPHKALPLCLFALVCSGIAFHLFILAFYLFVLQVIEFILSVQNLCSFLTLRGFG